MASLKEKFLEGCAKTSTSTQVAHQLWKDMEASQDYSFNKSHAACYALIAYRTAWLRANHPREYMAALISSVMNTKDRVPFYVNACHELGIEVLPPDVNTSRIDFAVVEGQIRFGLNAVKNVGGPAARAIVAERGSGGQFTSIWDFVERVDAQCVNKRSLESLVKCGALDGLGATRMGMLAVLDQAVQWGSQRQADKMAGQSSIFDFDDSPAEEKPRHNPTIPPGEFDGNELLKLEKEVLGLYVSDHPLSAIRDQLRKRIDTPMTELGARRDGDVVTVGGIVANLKQMTTKRGEPMVFLTLDDVIGSVEVVVFNSVYASSHQHLMTDKVLVVKGRIDHKEGETKLIALELTPFEAVPERKVLHLKLDARTARAGIIKELAELLRAYPGEASVFVAMTTSAGAQTLELGPGYRVKPDSDLFAEVKALLGPAAVV
jgi:DNA polymerase III subunit alpha